MKFRHQLLAVLATAYATLGLTLSSIAQELPDRTIRLIVPFAAGGGVDALARPFAIELGKALNRTVVVENKPSTTGQIGTAEVAKSPLDGTTLVISSAAFGTTPSFVPKLPYDIFKDFEPITILAATPQVLVAPVSFKASSFAEVLQMARSNVPVNVALPGSSGIQRLATELLISTAQIQVTKVPYKGAGAAFADLIAGRVDVMFDNPGSSMVHVNSGRLKVLATTGAKRLLTLPQVPTVAETFPGFEALNWFILAAPAGTPPTMLDRLNEASTLALRSDTMRQVLERDGLQPMANSRSQAQLFLRNEFNKWDRIVREKQLTAD